MTGLIMGVLATIAIQNLGTQNKNTVQDVVPSEKQQASTSGTENDSKSRAFKKARLSQIFKYDSILDQRVVLYSTVAAAQEQDLKEWWIQSKEIERKSHRETIQNAIVRKLATINPYETLGYIDDVSNFQSDALLHSIFSEWSVSQLDEAIEASNALSYPRRKVALESILETRDDLSDSRRRAIAIQLEGEETFLKLVSDREAAQSIKVPEESWEILLNDDVDDYLQTESLAIVARAWRDQAGFKVLSNIYQMQDHRIRFDLVNAVARLDLAGALNYTRGLVEENEQQYLSTIIVREWASEDAKTVLDVLSTFEPSSLASILENEAANTWARISPLELIENVDSISEEFRLYTLETAFSELAKGDPIDAIARLSSVENLVANTSTILDGIVFRWSFREPLAAAEWVVNNYGLRDPRRRMLLERVLPRWARINPIQAFELAIAQPTANEGLGLEHLVIGEITQDGDIEIALKLLPQVTEHTRQVAYTDVGLAMVRASRTEEAVELGTDLDGEQQQWYYRRVFNSWAQTNPKSLYETLGNLATNELKSGAAMQLILSNRITPLLSDDQIDEARTMLSDEAKTTIQRIEN
ncbi:MAG: hypothetical protein F4X56_08805 [Gammaproteobacteria bacterium]|nr:hypothetical protein [Gammaproteobacteria bacterium]MYC25999.1 hypothetical protein [Gammaproteobacteria bacterium]